MRGLCKLLLTILPLAMVPTAASAAEFVRMVSGPSGGSWYPLGAKMAEILGSKISGISTSSAPGAGVGNVRDINKRNAEIGWTYAHTAFNGFQGKGKFKSKQSNVRHFATLYPAALQAAVPKNSPIKSYMDMINKNISPGPKHFSGNAAVELLFDEYGLSYDKIKMNGGTIHSVSYKDSVALMKDGHIDAFMALTSVPQASFIDLNFSPGIRFLPIEPAIMEKFLAKNKGYIRETIPQAAYKNQAGDVSTIGVVTVLVINKDVPDKLAYQLAKVLWDNHAALVKVKKIWSETSLKMALNGAAIPVHPGAKRYYDEMGVK